MVKNSRQARGAPDDTGGVGCRPGGSQQNEMLLLVVGLRNASGKGVYESRCASVTMERRWTPEWG